MVISELALGLFTNFLYDSFKNIPEYISDTSSKVYEKAIEEFSNKNYKLTGIQIDTFFHQKNVERAIEKYLKNPNKLDCSNILIHEFFELFSEEDFSREDADLILNSFFEIIDAEIEKEPELREYLELYLAKETHKTTQEINQGVKELSQDVKEISHKVQEIHEVVNCGRENQDKKESGVDFEKSLEKYLNKIIDEDGKNGVSQVYTELSAKVLPISLKLYDKENDRSQEFEVLELVKKEEKLIISGESGSGKTTTLKWLNYILAKSYLEGRSENIPLYIELNSYIGEERFIKNPFDIYVARKAEGKGISEDTLKTILKEKAVILLDGFDLLSPTDEFHPYDKISNFIADYNNCRFVISSRPGFFESIKSSFKVSELEKLTDKKIDTFINRYVSNEELADNLKDKILSNEQLKPILSNPMMLYIVIKVAMGRKNKSDDLLPSNRSELYEDFIDILFSHQEEKGKCLHADRIQIENALTDLYFKLQCRNEVSCKYSEALKFVKKSSEDPIFKKISPQLILEDCFKLGILNKNDNHVSYGIHQSFQEYFAAIKLKEIFEAGLDISEAFSHPKWEEVVIFTSEMLDLDILNEYIDLMVSKGELFLAAKCVNKASDNTKEKLCALLSRKMDSKYELEKIISIESLGRIGTTGISIIVESLKDESPSVRWSAAQALGNVKSEIAVHPLINALKDENSSVRWGAAEALGTIKSDIAVQPLINALKDENSSVQLYAAEALENIKSETAVKLLINLLNDEDKNVRWNAARVLGNIKSEIAMQPLINALSDKEEYVRQSVAEALGNIEPDIAVQPLINALKDENSSVRLYAAEALGNIKSDIAVQPLINALKDENSSVRLYAAEALENIKSETAVKLLINLLNDEDKNAQGYAVKALGNIKSNTAVKLLINALKDENLHVRGTAAEALGDIKSETAVQPLINALNDKEAYVRIYAAEALGNIKSETAVQPLINSLKDENLYVRLHAAEALGNIEPDIAVQPLINLLNDEDRYVRWSVAKALGTIKSETAVQPLINALKDKNLHVRWTAAQSLGNVKPEAAVQPLINALKDENSSVRLYAAEALGNIKSDIAVQPLINVLKDENSYVRCNAAKALGNIKSDIAVQPLINVLKDENSYVRCNAAKALGNIKSDIAVQPLINALKDKNSSVRLYAAEALGNIKSETAVQQLINALKDEDSALQKGAAKVLGNIKSDTAVQPLINALKDEDEYVRRRAVEVLGDIKSETVVQPLINALKDEDENVRKSAAKALENICTVKNKNQLEDLLKSDHEYSVNTAFEILYEIEKEERSKAVLFKNEKFLKT